MEMVKRRRLFYVIYSQNGQNSHVHCTKESNHEKRILTQVGGDVMMFHAQVNPNVMRHILFFILIPYTSDSPIL